MKNKKYKFFFDFDNTITKFDVIDDLLPRFSKNGRWLELEQKWKNGEIGSRECLRGQINGVNITRRELDRYLSRIELDPYFKRLIRFLASKRIESIILSDNFDYILQRILKSNGIDGLKIYSNKLKFSGNRLIPRFNSNKNCKSSCGHCKNKSLSANKDKRITTVYIGDGLSDLCPAKKADLIFAKEDLHRRLKRERIEHIPYKELKDVYRYFKNNTIKK